ALALIVLATLVFSLGPYFPGFTLWSRLPGFSFFRAPARWSVATSLALCVLAGLGFDAFRDWARPGRSLALFAILAAIQPALVILGVELALESTTAPGWPAVVRGFDQALNLLPWSRVKAPEVAATGIERFEPSSSIRELAAQARRPQDDPYLRVR